MVAIIKLVSGESYTLSGEGVVAFKRNAAGDTGLNTTWTTILYDDSTVVINTRHISAIEFKEAE